MNGALKNGTLETAKIEIREEDGEENLFLFGLTTPEVQRRRSKGYVPRKYYEANANLKEVLATFNSGEFLRRDKFLRTTP